MRLGVAGLLLPLAANIMGLMWPFMVQVGPRPVPPAHERQQAVLTDADEGGIESPDVERDAGHPAQWTDSPFSRVQAPGMPGMVLLVGWVA